MKLRRSPSLVLAMLFLLMGVVLHVSALAQEPIVRAGLSGDDVKTPWVGQSVTVVVELLVPGYFDSATNFDLPDPEGVLLMKPSSSPLVGSETIDGIYYTVQRHELRAWPIQPGNLSIPAFSIRFSYKRNPLDKQVESVELTTKAIPLKAKLPADAQGLGTIISASNLQAKERWQPQPGSGEIKAGTAFTRTVTFTALDVPGMLFPQFPADPIDGLGVYSKRTLDDKENRGILTGLRQDEITYVCKQVGQFIIPAATFTWFDLGSGELKTKTFPEQILNVVANADLSSGDKESKAGATGKPFDWGKLGLLLGLLIVLVLVARTAAVRRTVAVAIAYLRPVHLQPLNPHAIRSKKSL